MKGEQTAGQSDLTHPWHEPTSAVATAVAAKLRPSPNAIALERTGTSEEPSLDALMARARQRDLEAFAQLYIRMLPAIQRQAASQGFQMSAAQDIAHDVFLRLLQNPDRYDTSRPAEAYVLGVSRNVMRERRRESGRARSALKQMPPAPAVPDPSAETEHRELAQMLAFACAQLSGAQGAALQAASADATNQSEVARKLGCTPGTLRSRLYEARRRMRQLLSSRTQLAIVPVNLFDYLRNVLRGDAKPHASPWSIHWAARCFAGLIGTLVVVCMLAHRGGPVEHQQPGNTDAPLTAQLPHAGEGAPSPGVGVEWWAEYL